MKKVRYNIKENGQIVSSRVLTNGSDVFFVTIETDNTYTIRNTSLDTVVVTGKGANIRSAKWFVRKQLILLGVPLEKGAHIMKNYDVITSV